MRVLLRLTLPSASRVLSTQSALRDDRLDLYQLRE